MKAEAQNMARVFNPSLRAPIQTARAKPCQLELLTNSLEEFWVNRAKGRPNHRARPSGTGFGLWILDGMKQNSQAEACST